MTITFDYVWKTLFGDAIRVNKADSQIHQLCYYICDAYNNKVICKNGLCALMHRMKIDHAEQNAFWFMLIGCDSFSDFTYTLPSYQKMRKEYPSTMAEPVDPMSLPLSNEKMYGKGINSRVRD